MANAQLLFGGGEGGAGIGKGDQIALPLCVEALLEAESFAGSSSLGLRLGNLLTGGFQAIVLVYQLQPDLLLS